MRIGSTHQIAGDSHQDFLQNEPIFFSMGWKCLPKNYKVWKIYKNLVEKACVLWLICCRSPCGSVDLNLSGFWRGSGAVGRSPCGSVDLNVGGTRKIKNAIERANQGSFYFVLFPQFYMYQTNKLRKEKSKNRLKYNYEREKDENSIFRKNRCRKQ